MLMVRMRFVNAVRLFVISTRNQSPSGVEEVDCRMGLSVEVCCSRWLRIELKCKINIALFFLIAVLFSFRFNKVQNNDARSH